MSLARERAVSATAVSGTDQGGGLAAVSCSVPAARRSMSACASVCDFTLMPSCGLQLHHTSIPDRGNGTIVV